MIFPVLEELTSYTGVTLPPILNDAMEEFVSLFDDEDGFHVDRERFSIPKPTPSGEDWSKSKNVMHYFIHLNSAKRASQLAEYLKKIPKVVVVPYEVKEAVQVYLQPSGW